MVVYSRPITFTPAVAQPQTRYLPANATLRQIRPPAQPAPSTTTTTQPGGLSGSGGELTDEMIAARAQMTVNRYPSAPFQNYTVQGGMWYGVSNVEGSTMYTRLNPATADTSPNPNYRYMNQGTGPAPFSEGSAGNVRIQPSARPEPPGAGATKAQIAAYSESLASWEREQLWRSVPDSANWTDISDWYGEARFDLPTQERRQWEINQSLLPTLPSAKAQAIESQYAAQQKVIVSSSGNLVPVSERYTYIDDSGLYLAQGERAADYRNVSTGALFSAPAVLDMGGKAVAAAPAAAGAGLNLVQMQLATMRSPFDITGRVDMGKVRGGLFSPQKRPEQEIYSNPFQGIPLLEQSAAVGNLIGGMWPGARVAGTYAVSLGQSVFPTAPVLSGFYETGQYVGLEHKITPLSKELSLAIPAFEKKWETKIQGEMFTGTADEYRQFSEEYSKLQQKSDRLDAYLGQQTALKQKMFGGKTPSTEEMFTYPVYSSAREFADWYGKAVAEPATNYITKHPYYKPYLSLYPGWGHLQMSAGEAAISEPAEALAGVAMLVPGAERLGRITLSEPGQFPTLVGTGLYLQAQGMYEGFSTRPMKTFVNLAYSAGYLHVTTAGLKFISPIGADVTRVPTGRITRSYDPVTGEVVETPIMTNIYGVYLKNPFAGLVFRPTDILRLRSPVTVLDFMGTRALGGYIAGRGFFTGSPVARFGETPIGSGFLPSTKAESAFVRPIMESRLTGEHLELYHRALDAVELAMSRKINPQALREYGMMKPKELTWDTWNRVLDYIETHRADIVAYGSTTQSVYLPRSRMSIGDIDLDIRPEVAEVHSRAIYDIIRLDPGMRDIGPLIREQSQLTEGRFVARHPTKGIILDLHPFWRAEWDVAGSIPTTGRGIKIMPLYETIGGKIYFSTNYREVVPGRQAIIEFGEGRFKDPADMAIMFGNLAEMEAARPLRWDINRLRFGARQRLAQRYLDIGRAYERYTTDFVAQQFPEALEYLQEAGFPASRANIQGGPVADWDIRVGAITEFKGEWYLHPKEIKMYQDMMADTNQGKIVSEDIFLHGKNNQEIFIKRFRDVGSVDFQVYGKKWVEVEGLTHTHPTSITDDFAALFRPGPRVAKFLTEAPGVNKFFSRVSGDIIQLDVPIKITAKDAPLHLGDLRATMGREGVWVNTVLSESYVQVGKIPRAKIGNMLSAMHHLRGAQKSLTYRLYTDYLKTQKIMPWEVSKRAQFHFRSYAEATRTVVAEAFRMAGGSFEEIPIQEVINRGAKPTTQPVNKFGYYKKLSDGYYSGFKTGYKQPIFWQDTTKKDVARSVYPYIAGLFSSPSFQGYPTSDKYPSPSSYISAGYRSSPEGNYPTGGYRSSPVGKYIEGKYTDYPVGGKYPSNAPYPQPPGKYPPVGKYIEHPTYRPPGKYKPGDVYRPTTPKYPAGGKPPTYPAKLIGPEYKTQAPLVSYKAQTKIESYLPKTPSQKPPKTPPKVPVFFPPESSMFVPITTRKTITRKEEEKHKKKLRLHFDVRGSKWLIKNPIPRPEVVLGGEAGKQYKNELRIYDKQYSKKTYTVHAPFDIITDYKVTKGLRF